MKMAFHGLNDRITKQNIIMSEADFSSLHEEYKKKINIKYLKVHELRVEIRIFV